VVPAVDIVRRWRPWEAPATLHLLVDGLQPEQRYQVRLLEVFDELGNPGRAPARPITFTAPVRSDTTRPMITAVDPGDSTRVLNSERIIRLTFTTAVERESVSGWVLAGPDTTGEVALGMTWLDPLTLEVQPRARIEPDAFYRLTVPAGSLRSWTGLNGPVEDLHFAWQGIREPGRGTLRLTVEGEPLSSGSSWVVFIEGAGSGTTPLTRLEFTGREEFVTPELLEGAYRVWGFVDADGNGRLDAGQATPWRPAEIVGVLSDTLYVIDSFESVYETPLDLRPARAGKREEIPPR
jgi:hypothetical protein